ncbi:hypothetical protein COLO4_36585 [Corchorus olitorius]|uniref:Uncharacterized protein n=1 Tax=Corchorus olitorius TaxID=93759 RepID=A0A1R3G7V3_9ROSI|nr:hypothetical protein COLO4_36585 [Corchorus olitorius]
MGSVPLEAHQSNLGFAALLQPQLAHPLGLALLSLISG